MNGKKRIATIAFCVFMICLLLAPVCTLYFISKSEQSQYQTETIPAVNEMAYGDVVSVVRRDMSETITLNGTVVSASEFFSELKVRDPYSLRFTVSEGDVIHPGDLIAYDGSKKVLSDAYGLISEINLGSSPYLRLSSLDDLAIECYVTEAQRTMLQRSSIELCDEHGVALEVINIDDVCTDGNMTKVLLRYEKDGLRYGQTVSNLSVTTGKVYEQALVVLESCVYQKDGSDEYFLRLVNENGEYLSETEVQIGYSNGEYICVSGVEEGALCDSGYKTFAEG